MKLVLIVFVLRLLISFVFAGALWGIEWIMSQGSLCAKPGLWNFIGFFFFAHLVFAVRDTYLSYKDNSSK